jgi:hypothetical protein
MNMTRLILIATVFMLVSSKANATTGNQLLSSCAKVNSASCISYVSGVIETYQLVVTA